MATAAPTGTGRVIQITGPVVDIEFPAGQLPSDPQRGRDRPRRRRSARLRGPAAPRQQLGPLRRDDDDRRPRPRRVRPRHRRAHHRAGRRGHARSRLRRARPADRRQGSRHERRLAADPSLGARLRPAVDRGRGLRDRAQGHRPHLPVQEGRQDRHLRRGRRRQDGHHPGADPQRRPGARGLLGVRRRRRAQPRGQRPHPGDDRIRRPRQDRVRLRPDERAARRAPAGRADRPDDGRVLPRRGGPRRPALHRQHLPLHPGRLRGLGAPRPDAVGGRLPAEPGHRDGPAPGAHHLDQEGLDHVAPGGLRAGRRLHGPGSGDDVRAPRLDDPPRAEHRRARHLPGRRPADLDVARPRPDWSSARTTTTSPRRPSASCSATATSRTSSRSSASTSCPRRTRRRSPAPVGSSAS